MYDSRSSSSPPLAGRSIVRPSPRIPSSRAPPDAGGAAAAGGGAAAQIPEHGDAEGPAGLAHPGLLLRGGRAHGDAETDVTHRERLGHGRSSPAGTRVEAVVGWRPRGSANRG